MEYIYGKLNNEVGSVNFTGVSSKTAYVTVDNSNRTIQVDVRNTSSTITASDFYGDFLTRNTYQNLSSDELDIIYDNLKLSEYLSNKGYLVSTSSSQTLTGGLTITGNLTVKGNINTSSKYLTLNYNGSELSSSESMGIKFSTYSDNKDAFLFIKKDGNLYYGNSSENNRVALLDNDELTYNKFLFWNNQEISTRELKPSDIDTTDYIPSSDSDLVTSSYLKSIIASEAKYIIVEDETELNSLDAFEGLRVFVLSDNKESA